MPFVLSTSQAGFCSWDYGAISGITRRIPENLVLPTIGMKGHFACLGAWCRGCCLERISCRVWLDVKDGKPSRVGQTEGSIWAFDGERDQGRPSGRDGTCDELHSLSA